MGRFDRPRARHAARDVVRVARVGDVARPGDPGLDGLGRVDVRIARAADADVDLPGREVACVDVARAGDAEAGLVGRARDDDVARAGDAQREGADLRVVDL